MNVVREKGLHCGFIFFLKILLGELYESCACRSKKKKKRF